MLHALLLVLGSALASKLGFRDLTPEEEADLPSYFVKAERIRRAVAVFVLFAMIASALLAWVLQ